MKPFSYKKCLTLFYYFNTLSYSPIQDQSNKITRALRDIWGQKYNIANEHSFDADALNFMRPLYCIFFVSFYRHLALIFNYVFLYTVFVCKFRPEESQNDVFGDLRLMVSLAVGSYFGMPPLLFPGVEPASPGTPDCVN